MEEEEVDKLHISPFGDIEKGINSVMKKITRILKLGMLFNIAKNITFILSRPNFHLNHQEVSGVVVPASQEKRKFG